MTEQRYNILVVDDETAIGQILKAGLEMHGFTVRYEAHSPNAIQACLEFQPDLVLLDLDMPVKDGGVVATELQSHPTLRQIPVIILTGLVCQKEAANRNASDEILLSKATPIAEVAARIRAVLQSKKSSCLQPEART